MTITTRAELITAICDYLQNDDLSTQAPMFIQLAEAMFNRRLFVMGTQATSTSLTAAATVNVPSDFNGIVSIHLADYSPLAQLGPDDFQALFAEDTATGQPEYFMLANGVMHLGPPPNQAYAITLKYRQKLNGLSASVTTNWLLTAHPDLYLYASLLQAELFGWNDSRVPLFKEAVDITLSEIAADDARARRNDLAGVVPVSYF